MSESRFYHIPRAGKPARVATLADALAAAKVEGFLWLDYCQPTNEELSALIGPLGLHPLSVEDCTDENQVPKIEDFPGNTFIIFNSVRYSNKTLSIDEVDLFLGDRFLVTVSGRDASGRPLLSDIGRIAELDVENARKGPSFLLHIVLDHVVDQKFVAIEALQEELDNAEDAMLADLSRFNPAELVRLRRDLLALRKSLFHEREILVKICRKDSPFISEKAIFHYRDIYDHLAKFFELIETSRDIVTSLMEMYLSMLNNQMAKTANETNATVRRLTFITTIFMPLTLLAGVGGMSEWSMMTGAANWKISYPVFMAAMVVVGIANYYLLKWFEKKDRDPDRPAGGE
ncbi:MAG TPA: magnesium transporter CorA family protein [Syntrophobacteria bacterium]|nr:magnesium transporter CorA family protein [Syntrophobacteria bacterium]